MHNILTSALDALTSLSFERDVYLLRSPLIRAKVNDIILRHAINTNSVFKLELDQTKLVQGTIEHNLDGLLHGNGNLDRGASLTELCLADMPKDLVNRARVLHIGSRNLNELLCSLSFGVNPETLYGIDLISYHPSISLGDMHNMSFRENFFDIIILGWVLGYSRDLPRAVSELMRVASPDCRIAIGWDFNSFNYYGDRGYLSGFDQPYVNDCESILEHLKLAGLTDFKTIYCRDPMYPYDAWGRQCVIVLQRGSRFSHSKTRMKVAEANAVGHLIHHLPSQADSTIKERLGGHLEFLQTGDTTDRPYLLMRHHYVKYGNAVDELLSQAFSAVFPKILSNEQFFSSEFFGPHSCHEISSIVDTLRTKGFYRFPTTLKPEVIERLRHTIEWKPSETSRRFAEEISLLRNQTSLALWCDDVLLSIVESYLNSFPILDFLSATWTTPFMSQSDQSLDTDAQMWHFDKDRIKFLKVFVYLTDVTIENGPHEFILGSHLSQPPRDGRLSEEEINARYKDSDRLLICGPAGTVFIEDTHGLHRGKPVEKADRMLLQLEYANSLFGQNIDKLSIDLFLPKFRSLISKAPRLFERFV